jgi:hypothetical protein
MRSDVSDKPGTPPAGVNTSQDAFKEFVMAITIRWVRFSVVLVVVLASMVTRSSSQVTMKLGGGVGVTIPASDFGGSSLEYYNGSRYGLSSGLNLHAKAKVGLSGWDVAGEVHYSSLRNTGYSEPGQGTMDISQEVLSVKVGPEFRISLPALPVTSYVGANFAMNRFNGETNFQGVAKVQDGTYSVKGATRFGAGISAGTEVSLAPFMSFDFNVSYNLMNLFGKGWEDVNSGVDQRVDSYLSLNDDQDPMTAAGDDKHFISAQRDIHTIQFTVSVLFGL